MSSTLDPNLTANVVRLGSAAVTSDRRALFLEAVAQSFELFVQNYGYEPDAVTYTLGGITQPSQIGWSIQGSSKEGVVSVLSMAAVHMLAEAQAGRQGIND